MYCRLVMCGYSTLYCATEHFQHSAARTAVRRRDFTINSLFYRIDGEEVEDFTERGLADLDAQVIRTPLPASETFMDGACPFSHVHVTCC